MGLLSAIFGKSKPAAKEPVMVTMQLNAKLMPIERGEYFEDPLLEYLERTGYGDVDGGGTMQNEDGEIAYCDVALLLNEVTEDIVASIVAKAEELGAPKGSKLFVGEASPRLFGRTEGLGIYLNGTDLSDETYANCDSNFVRSEMRRLLEDQGRVMSFWNGNRETAFYLYGNSFLEMQRRIAGFVASYPLCAKSRVVQIA